MRRPSCRETYRTNSESFGDADRRNTSYLARVGLLFVHICELLSRWRTVWRNVGLPARRGQDVWRARILRRVRRKISMVDLRGVTFVDAEPLTPDETDPREETHMKLVIFGANGPTGRLATQQAIAEGHTVT